MFYFKVKTKARDTEATTPRYMSVFLCFTNSMKHLVTWRFPAASSSEWCWRSWTSIMTDMLCSTSAFCVVSSYFFKNANLYFILSSFFLIFIVLDLVSTLMDKWIDKKKYSKPICGNTTTFKRPGFMIWASSIHLLLHLFVFRIAEQAWDLLFEDQDSTPTFVIYCPCMPKQFLSEPHFPQIVKQG